MVNVVVRSLCVIVVGVLMIALREAFLPVIVQVIGAAFVVSGVISLFNLYIMYKKSMAKFFDTAVLGSVGVAAVALGAWLLLSPAFFLSLLMLILGILLLLSGLYQVTILLAAQRKLSLSFYMYIVPLLLVAAGLFVIVNPFDAMGLPFLLVGVGAVLAGVSDLAGYLYLSHRRRALSK